jgi:multicomponent Na+:H+ antiporter subunit B
VSEALLAGLLFLLVVLGVIAVRAADLLLAAIALGGYGLVMALIWASLGAVDVAFTEAVVGAGATTVLFLAALLRTSRRRSPVANPLGWGAGVLVAATGAAVLWVTAALPPWGDPTAAPAVHVSPRYLVATVAETGTPNAVTAVLADYRGYDTLVETVVIVTSGLACWLLLRRDPA